MDLQLRALNIILFNIHEYSASSPDQVDDASYVVDLFITICVHFSQISVLRMGKLTNKPRFIHVIWPTPADVFDVLKVKKKLFGFENFKAIRIASDQSIKQRKYFSKIMADMKSRKDASENN